ncbi:MAG: 50S ribosomal protein L28 [Candidatus Melainabacteria bacterium RIFOXYA12_FULL_32_12]|nr:MAG: 50S ribosomal protein L28 [Candidatus Melainabacteria bacterium GWF2_32_7]OGI17263.1 MAG: 50S ribosomal protein L28 [Candidatus Melainabacteria bacterium RIFOXYA2_FULL_32_9]OGI24227.1 MAG: 50S ribosomal protein L28 [Candidatus Melainabacteria bacterium RIFOXYA12_FULL_32_12]
MSKQCTVCGKTPLKANKVSFSNKHHRYRQFPNLQSIRANINGTVKKISICTSCIKANKVQKAI